MPKILMVEDDKFVGGMYQRLFTANGYDVKLIHNGAEALALLADGTYVPDLITLDVHLPEMDGHELLTRIKQDARLKDIATVVLTNSFFEENSKEFMNLGADLFLVKIHNNNEEVLAKIKALLEQKSKG